MLVFWAFSLHNTLIPQTHFLVFVLISFRLFYFTFSLIYLQGFSVLVSLLSKNRFFFVIKDQSFSYLCLLRQRKWLLGMERENELVVMFIKDELSEMSGVGPTGGRLGVADYIGVFLCVLFIPQIPINVCHVFTIF